MLSAHINVSMAPVTVHSANTDPTSNIAMLEPDVVSVTRVRLSRIRVSASSGTTPSSLLTIVVTASASATRLKTPTAISITAGIARKA